MNRSDHIASYRPDIDGLRAFAVLSVIAFHAFPSLARGGFIGVDIFFVISGFLITGIIAQGIESGRFSFLGFYARRIRRIVPALTVVLLATLAFGWFVLLPDELSLLGMHVLTSSAFVANIHLWSESGYFDTVAETKPLLHLWSLGVEEQFYIVWPVLLWFLRNNRAKWIVTIFGVLVVSFAINVLIVGAYPSAAFYSPASRFWEIAIGAVLALAQSRVPGSGRFSRAVEVALSSAGYAAHIRGLAGFALIGAAEVLVTPDRPFPGWWALLPTIGAALIISAGASSWVNRFLLANPPAVFIGLISYPLYLWHWPILSFGRILAGGLPTIEFRCWAVVASLALAWLTYRLVERPMRTAARGIPAALLASLAAIAALGALSPKLPVNHSVMIANPDTMKLGGDFWDYATDGCGLPDDLTKQVHECWTDKRERPEYAVWGDSKAGALYPGLLRQSNPGQRWMQLGAGGCAPLTGIVRLTLVSQDDDPRACAHANEIIGDALEKSTDIKAVALVTASRIVSGPSYAADFSSPPYADAVIDGLNNSARRLHAAGKAVYFVIDNPTLPDPKDCTQRVLHISSVDRNPCYVSIQEHLRATEKYRSLVDKFRLANPYVIVLDPTNLLCNEQQGVCPIQKDGGFLYSYSDHMSDVGNQIVGRALLALMNAKGP